MINPPPSGMNSMNNTLDFVKNVWGMMGIQGMNGPGMVVPTLSVEELDKKISDLKTVESWLSVNMNLLRGTIQALEVQRATIATLKSMGDSFSEAVNQARAPEKPADTPSAYSFPDFSSSRADKAPSSPSPAPQKEPESEPAATATSDDKKNAAEANPQLVNPAAWWNVLQDQFKHAVSTAMAPEAAPIPKAATPSASKNAAKPPVKKAAPRAPAKAKPKATKAKPAAS